MHKKGIILGVAIALLAGCSGGPASSVAPASNPLLAPDGPFASRPAHPLKIKSWMSPEAKKKGRKLLYISDDGAWVVDVYTTDGKLVGQITGLISPVGMCTDKNQDVYVVVQDYEQSPVVQEYAHAGTTPIATYDIPGGAFPNGCAIDPTNGTLAVSYKPFCCSTPNGYVVFMSSPSATPSQLVVPNMGAVYYMGYDSQGDLIADGTGTASLFGQLAELSNGATSFTPLTLNGAQTGKEHWPGTIQWAGGSSWYIGDQGVSAGSVYSISVLYEATLSGTTFTVNTTSAFGNNNGLIAQGMVWYKGERFVGPDSEDNNVQIYSLPSGRPLRALNSGWIQPAGAVMSGKV
ncbi:MAG TPA: hypothetical protein VMF61_06535 [Candidatus Acidoferrales bacterium]|nr:hypothetical protein [Candidatus Acidoferrales bacterium]